MTAVIKRLVAAVTAAVKKGFSAAHLKVEYLISMALRFVGPEALNGNLVHCENVFLSVVI